MRVYCAPGLRVKDPRTRQFIGDDGVEVGEHDFVFVRLIADGDLVTEPPAPAAEGAAPAEVAQSAPAKAAAPAKAPATDTAKPADAGDAK